MDTGQKEVELFDVEKGQIQGSRLLFSSHLRVSWDPGIRLCESLTAELVQTEWEKEEEFLAVRFKLKTSDYESCPKMVWTMSSRPYQERVL